MDYPIVPTDKPNRELLLLADESEASIADYINRSQCYVVDSGERIIGQYLLLPTRPFTAEIINLAVDPHHQHQGIATALIKHAIATSRSQGFHILEIGTGNSSTAQIALYERNGFVQYGVDKDYFRKYYPAPIFENGIECRDMVRLRMEL